MATVDQHIEQWKHNRRFARQIDGAYRDWQITVIFYASLHAVDAALAKLGIQVQNHEARNNTVRANASFASIREAYLNLYRISKVTRYDADPDEWLPDEFLTVPDLIQVVLQPIEVEVERILGVKLNLGALTVKQ